MVENTTGHHSKCEHMCLSLMKLFWCQNSLDNCYYLFFISPHGRPTLPLMKQNINLQFFLVPLFFRPWLRVMCEKWTSIHTLHQKKGNFRGWSLHRKKHRKNAFLPHIINEKHIWSDQGHVTLTLRCRRARGNHFAFLLLLSVSRQQNSHSLSPHKSADSYTWALCYCYCEVLPPHTAAHWRLCTSQSPIQLSVSSHTVWMCVIQCVKDTLLSSFLV